MSEQPPNMPPIEAMVRFADEVLARVASLNNREQAIKWAADAVEKARKSQAGELNMLRNRIEWLDKKLTRQHEYLTACRAKDRCEILRLRAELKKARKTHA